MKKYYITNGILHYEKCGLYNDTGNSFELADDQQELVIPEGVTWLAHGCFRNNGSIRRFVFPKSLEIIDGWAFQNCTALEEIVIPDSVSVADARGMFSYCTALKKVVLPTGLTAIPSDMFKGCTALREIVIPEGVRQIAVSAFQDCASLKKINIPQNVRIIGGNAFRGCTSLERIALPEGVTQIGWNTFEDCTALREVSLPEGIGSIDSKIFAGCTSLREITLPKSVRYIGWNAFFRCISLRRIEMNGVRDIDGAAFEGCGNLKELELSPELVLGYGMLQNIPCKTDELSGMRLSMDGRILMGICEEDAAKKAKITEITIPEGVTHIADRAFGFSYKKLEKVTFPTSLRSIGSSAFFDSALTEVILPEGVRVIGEGAFQRCRALEKVILPEGLSCIERQAFWECENLREITVPSTLNRVGKSIFYQCDKVPSHILPDSIRQVMLWNRSSAYEFVPDGKLDAEPSKEGTIQGLLRFFSPRVIAQLIVHQKSKAVMEDISKGFAQSIGKIDLLAVCKAICTEIASVKKKAFDTAAAFYTDYAERLTAEDIRSFIAVLESKKALKNIETLQANAAIQNKLNAESDAPAAEQHPMESSLGERAEKVFEKETIATLRKAGRDLRTKGQIPDGIVYSDGTPVSDTAFAFMVGVCEGRLSIMDTFRSLRADGWQEVLPLIDALDQGAFHAAMHQMFDQKMYEKNAWLVALMCVFGDEKLLAKIISMKNKWADWYAWGSVGKELNRSIDHWTLHSPTREALVFADKNNRLAWYAQIHHTTESALRGRLLADFGFDEKGVRVFHAGDAEIEASLNPDASVQLYNRKTGKVTKSFPKKGEPNDGEVFAAWKKQLSTVVKSRVKALKEEFAQGNLRSYESWQEENCSNPIYSALAKGVVWGVYDTNGAYQLSFRLNDEMQKVDAGGEEVEIGEETRISVLHPVDCQWEEIKAWKEVFSLIAQPIEQLDVPVRLPDVQTLVSRYEGCTVNVGKLLHGMNGIEEEGTVTGGNDTVKVMIVHGWDYWGEYPVEEVLVNKKTFADKRKYSTDILQMDNLLNPFVKAEAAIAEKDISKVREMVGRGLIIRDNIQNMISRAAEEGAVEISLYLIELSRQWGMAEDEDDLSL